MADLAQRFADLMRRGRELDGGALIGWLIGPDAFGAAIAFERDKIVVRRARLAGQIFAVLFVAWTAIDIAALGLKTGSLIGIGRLITGAAFALMVLYCGKPGRRKARPTLALVFSIPVLFYAYAMSVLWASGIDLAASAIAHTYVELPFIAVACVALFPLGAIEGALLISPYIIAAVGVATLPGTPFGTMLNFGVAWLVTVVGLIAVVASVSQLRFMTAVIEQSSRDPLTGVLSRRVGEEILRLSVDAARRQGVPFAVVFLDLDHFKGVNDGYGHSAGDALLTAVGKTLRELVRGQDAVIRWGGEEFVLLLFGTSAAGALRLASRIGARGLAVRPDGATQTASVGYAEMTVDGLSDGAALVALADARMYRAKQAGRNRIIGPDGAASVFRETAPVPDRAEGLAAA